MRFLWRIWLANFIIMCFWAGSWYVFVASWPIVLLLSSYRMDIVEQLVKLDRNVKAEAPRKR